MKQLLTCIIIVALLINSTVPAFAYSKILLAPPSGDDSGIKKDLDENDSSALFEIRQDSPWYGESTIEEYHSMLKGKRIKRIICKMEDESITNEIFKGSIDESLDELLQDDVTLIVKMMITVMIGEHNIPSEKIKETFNELFIIGVDKSREFLFYDTQTNTVFINMNILKEIYETNQTAAIIFLSSELFFKLFDVISGNFNLSHTSRKKILYHKYLIFERTHAAIDPAAMIASYQKHFKHSDMYESSYAMPFELKQQYENMCKKLKDTFSTMKQLVKNKKDRDTLAAFINEDYKNTVEEYEILIEEYEILIKEFTKNYYIEELFYMLDLLEKYINEWSHIKEFDIIVFNYYEYLTSFFIENNYYLLRLMQSMLSFVEKEEKTRIEKAKVTFLNMASSYCENEYRKDKFGEIINVIYEFLGVLKRMKRMFKNKGYDKSSEYASILEIMAHILIDKFYFEDNDKVVLEGKPMRQQFEQVRRVIDELTWYQEMMTLVLNYRRKINYTQKILEAIQIVKQLIEKSTETGDNELYPLEMYYEFIVPLLFLTKNYREAYEYAKKRIVLLERTGVKNKRLMNNTVSGFYFTLLNIATFFDYEHVSLEEKENAIGLLISDSETFKKSHAGFFESVESLNDIFDALRSQQYEKALTICNKIITQQDNALWHTAVIWRIFILCSLNRFDDLKEIITQLPKAQKNKEIIRALLREYALNFLWLPLAAQNTVSTILIEEFIQNQDNTEADDTALMYLICIRDESLQDILKKGLIERIENKPHLLKKYSLDKFIELLEYFYSVDLYQFLNNIDIKKIPDQTVRKKISNFKADVFKAVQYDPKIFLPRLEELFDAAKYDEISTLVINYKQQIRGLEPDQRIMLIYDKANQISLLIKEGDECYAKHEFTQALKCVDNATALNVNDMCAHDLRNKITDCIAVYTRYQRNECTEALQYISLLIDPKHKNVTLNELKNRIELFIQAKTAMTNDADAAVRMVQPLAEKYPDDTAVQVLLEEINAHIRQRNALLSKAEEHLQQEKYEIAKKLFIKCLRMSPGADKIKKRLLNVLKILYGKRLYDITHKMARGLLVLYPDDTTVSSWMDKAWCQILIALLKPHRNILSAYLAAERHKLDRIKREYGEPQFYYSSLKFVPEGFIVSGLKWKMKQPNNGLTRTVPIQNIKRAGITYRGDSFRIIARTGEIFCSDYFSVVDVGEQHITFKCETLEQRERAIALLDKKGGYIEKGEDITLIRQKEAVSAIISKLEQSVETPYITTGNQFLDILCGLKKEKVNHAIIDMDKIKLELLQQGINDDQSQLDVVTKSILSLSGVKEELRGNRVTLIQGPPGTGKTTTIAEIVNHYRKQGKKILVLSQSNPAVNNVGEQLVKNSIPFARVGNQEDKVSVTIKEYWENREKLLDEFKKKYLSDREGFIVLGTHNGYLNDKYIANDTFFLEYDVVVIEEGARATIAETAVAMNMLKLNGKLIVVEDHEQLPAYGIGEDQIAMIRDEIFIHGLDLLQEGLPLFDTVFERKNIENYKRSLWERVLLEFTQERNMDLDSHVLLVNRRSHPLLVGLINIFYDGILKPRDYNKNVKEVPEEDTLVLVDMVGTEQSIDHSIYNIPEVNKVMSEFSRLFNQRDNEGNYRYSWEDITVISPYLAQNEMIKFALQLKMVVDKIRTYKGKTVPLTEEEKEVLRESIDSRSYVGNFIAHFIEAPYPEKIRDFLKYVKFKIPLDNERPLILDNIKKVMQIVRTMDSIQGQENKTVIVSLVRSNGGKGRSFFESFDGMQRLNVALSRAQEKMIIIGDLSHTLTKVQTEDTRVIFKKILRYVQHNGLYIHLSQSGYLSQPQRRTIQPFEPDANSL